jgi:hypothetical protein
LQSAYSFGILYGIRGNRRNSMRVSHRIWNCRYESPGFYNRNILG